ncbi:MAG TPA: phage portal protein [Lachnospiraceae bacterium]|nr:phage portal protein [Lachnospiraceae bacterium]
MFKSNQVISGTFGECWIDDNYVAEVTAVKATLSAKTETISQCRQLMDGTKVTGIEAKGEIKMNKISSRFISMLANNLKKGIQTEFTIISKLDDPAAMGCERIKLMGCTFTEVNLIDWELKKLSEESNSFTFTDFELLDIIETPQF